MRIQKFSLLFCFICIIQTQIVSAVSIENLLKGYAENDIELQELSINVQQQMINAKKVGIENGVNIALSTGTMEFDFENTVTVTPELTLDFPFLNNTSVQVQTPLAFGDNTELTEASVQISTDIISSDAKNVALSTEQANRNVELASRALKNKTLSVEENFWLSLQALYTLESNILIAEDNLIEEQVDFELIQTQGFSTQSASYRTQELSVKTAERTVEEATRLFSSELQLFLVDCGFTPNEINELPLLPLSLENTELLSIQDFDSTLFESIETSQWNAEYNEKMRNADTNFTLKAEGYFEQTTTATTNTKENNVGVGLNADWNGVTMGAGVLLPVENMQEPKLSLSLSWNMNTSRLSSLTDEEKEYEENLDVLSIEKAQNAYEQQVQTSLSDALDLEWEKETNKEELDLYEELYTDTQTWYEQGIVSSLDLLQAKTNYEQALAKSNASLIDMKIYNLKLSQLFIGE